MITHKQHADHEPLTVKDWEKLLQTATPLELRTYANRLLPPRKDDSSSFLNTAYVVRVGEMSALGSHYLKSLANPKKAKNTQRIRTICEAFGSEPFYWSVEWLKEI